jgi:single-strand DNA-binding protein
MANLSFNHIILAGRLSKDPETKTTPSGTQICCFTIAVNKRRRQNEPQQANFFDCVSAGKTAETVARYFKKGSSILISGEIDIDTWTDAQSGQKRSKPSVFANEVKFVDSLADSGAAGAAEGQNPYNAPQTPQTATAAYGAQAQQPQYQPNYGQPGANPYPPLTDVNDGELPF